VISAAGWIAMVTVAPLLRHPLHVTRTAAADRARATVPEQYRGSAWRYLPLADEGGGPQHRFVWETAGPSTYTSLLGTDLDGPGWSVFVRTFAGDVAERADMWTVHLDADGRVDRVRHDLPESRPGASLDEGAARQLARRTLVDRFHVDAADLQDVSVVPSKLPQRTDWTLTFRDGTVKLPRGEARLSIRIVGDQATDARRFVFVPEDWERQERNAETLASIVTIAGTVVAVVAIIGGAIAAIVSWSHRRFAVRLCLAVFAVFIAFAGARFANNFPAAMAALSTSQPLQLQLLLLLASGAIGFAVQSAAMGLVAGGVPAWVSRARLDSGVALRLGVALGAIGAAARALGAPAGSRGPAWPSYGGATSFVPFAAAALNPAVTMLSRTIFLLLLVATVDRITRTWTRRRLVAGALLVIVAGVTGATGSPLSLGPWAVSAIAIGALLLAAYVLVLRTDVSIVPIAVATMTIAAALREGAASAYSGAFAGTIVGAVVMAAIAYWIAVAIRAATV
jgi:hypothetical protein